MIQIQGQEQKTPLIRFVGIGLFLAIGLMISIVAPTSISPTSRTPTTRALHDAAQTGGARRGHMAGVVQKLEPDIGMYRDHLTDIEEVFFRPAVYSILDRAIQRDPAVFTAEGIR